MATAYTAGLASHRMVKRLKISWHIKTKGDPISQVLDYIQGQCVTI